MLKTASIVLVIVGALLVLAIRFLPWWASVLVVVGLGLGIRFGAGFVLRRVLTLPFKAKGKVLSGATVDLHAIEPAPVPAVSFEGDEDEEMKAHLLEEQAENEALHWYFIDMTITPTQASAAFGSWEPGELMFVSLDAKPQAIEEDEGSKLEDYQILIDGVFQEDEVGKQEGPQRVKFHVGLPQAMHQIQLRYYFELFGNVQVPYLPESTTAQD